MTWEQGPAKGLIENYSGQVNDDGRASGTITRLDNFKTDSWRTSDTLLCTAPAAAPPPPAPPASPAPPPPVTDAIALSFSPPGFGSITATVTNSSELTAQCTYDATAPLIHTHRDFTVKPNDSSTLTFTGFNAGISYHVEVSCHDASGKQTQEIGHADKDVTF